MRIHFDNVNLLAPTGPNTFAYRLARGLLEGGHEVVFENGPKADVSLVFIQPTRGAQLAKKVVQRLDGIWSKPEDFRTKNVDIKRLYKDASAVVFQSEFDRTMTTKWFGDPPRYNDVIYNGIDLTPVKELTIPALIDFRSMYEQIYVCSSHWHPQKRLDANVRLFERLHKKHPSSCLLVLGKDPNLKPHPHIFFTGHIPPEMYMQIYSAANYLLHLAWGDHCPNVVVEALSQGTPVVCSEVGGTRELVRNVGQRDYGLVMKERAKYDFELVNYDDPPDIDVELIEDLPGREQLGKFHPANIDIKRVTEKYVKLFESIL